LGTTRRHLQCIWADGGYHGKIRTWVQTHFPFTLEIVMRPFPKSAFVPLPKRWIVGRTFAWLSAARRLSKDYKVLPQSSEAFIYIALIRIMLRQLSNTAP
jgi:transposase